MSGSYEHNPPIESVMDKTFYAARLVGGCTTNPDCVIVDESGVGYLVTSKWLIKALDAGLCLKDEVSVGSMSGMGFYGSFGAPKRRMPAVRITLSQPEDTITKAQIKLLFLTGLTVVVNDGWVCSIGVQNRDDNRDREIPIRLSQYGTKVADQLLAGWYGDYCSIKLRIILDDSIEEIELNAFNYILGSCSYAADSIVIDVHEMTDESAVYRVWRLLVEDIIGRNSFHWFSEVEAVIEDTPERKARIGRKALSMYVTSQALLETIDMFIGVPIRFIRRVFQPVKSACNVILDILGMLALLVLAGCFNVAAWTVNLAVKVCKLYSKLRGIPVDDDDDDQSKGMKFIALH